MSPLLRNYFLIFLLLINSADTDTNINFLLYINALLIGCQGNLIIIKLKYIAITNVYVIFNGNLQHSIIQHLFLHDIV